MEEEEIPLEAVLEFLRKNEFCKTLSALIDELAPAEKEVSGRSPLMDELPRLSPLKLHIYKQECDQANSTGSSVKSDMFLSICNTSDGDGYFLSSSVSGFHTAGDQDCSSLSDSSGEHPCQSSDSGRKEVKHDLGSDRVFIQKQARFLANEFFCPDNVEQIRLENDHGYAEQRNVESIYVLNEDLARSRIVIKAQLKEKANWEQKSARDDDDIYQLRRHSVLDEAINSGTDGYVEKLIGTESQNARKAVYTRGNQIYLGVADDELGLLTHLTGKSSEDLLIASPVQSEESCTNTRKYVCEGRESPQLPVHKLSKNGANLQQSARDIEKQPFPSAGRVSDTRDQTCSGASFNPCIVKGQDIDKRDYFEHFDFTSATSNDHPFVEETNKFVVEEDQNEASGSEDLVNSESEDIEDNKLQVLQTVRDYKDEYEEFDLKIMHRRNRTGFEEEKDFLVEINSIIAGRYLVTEYLGSAAFSKAIQAHDIHTGMDVCIKVIRNNKDFLDQSLDEIKLLKYVNRHDPADQYHILRLYDFFYYREHLFIVSELLKANLYEFQTFNKESGDEYYFNMPRLQSIARQVLESLGFLHSIGLIHCDVKPENILVKSFSRCEVKVIDLGSSCFQSDNLCSYVQSRSYRAPEVILGLPYDEKIDIWSLGCVLAELCSGKVLFQNDSVATLLASIVSIIGPIDPDMLARGTEAHKYFTEDHLLYEQDEETGELEYIIPSNTSLARRLPTEDTGFIEFVGYLLQIDPLCRPTATEALEHPWLSFPYEDPNSITTVVCV